MDLAEYIGATDLLGQNELEKAKLFAYFHFRSQEQLEFSVRDVCDWFSEQNLSRPNASRLRTRLRGSRLFVNGQRNGTFRLHATAIKALDERFLDKFTVPESQMLKTLRGIFIDHSRIAELLDIESQNFDFTKLATLCEELNAAHKSGSKHSIIMLTRAIIDHVPPIFGCKDFAEVANNYSGSGRSFKSSMKNLQDSSRKIADQHLHTPIRKKESLPTIRQVDYSNDVDVLLAEIVRVLKS